MSALEALRERTRAYDDAVETLVADAPAISPATRDRLAVVLRSSS